ncbi:MAG: TIR domain-containing protein, partial [Anaerolineae bacterium]|nr:TIR domain-containing protein [Anaerolineae bacterium]
MPKVFISYSRKDEDFVRKLAKSLSEMKDISLWLDIDSIPTGMNWSTAIQQGLEACEMMLVIISPDSMNSRNVENEWQYFLDKGKRVIPVLCRLADLHFQLNRLQYIDFHSRGFDLAMSQLKEVLTSPEVKTSLLVSPGIRETEGALAPKTILQGRYRIHGAVATGKFGTVVYQAYDLQFQEVDVVRLVAVKEINFHISDVEARQIAIRQFQREVNLLASLQHRAVPTVIDYFTVGNYAYLVTPYIQGYDLDSLLMMNADLLPVEKVIRWGVEIAEVLAYLHSRSPQSIILRDLKPSNLMIDQQESVWVVGFGVAKPFIPNIKGTIIGAEGYSPPELYKGSAYPASDVYSLGAVLHHLLT